MSTAERFDEGLAAARWGPGGLDFEISMSGRLPQRTNHTSQIFFDGITTVIFSTAMIAITI